MPTVRGKAEVRSFIAGIHGQAQSVLRGAARAAANVVADEARDRTRSSEVRGSIKVAVATEDSRVVAKVQTKGPGAYIAPWEEYGTAPHFISVDESQRRGMGVKTINKRVKEGSLVINGKFVGTTVHHPGARPHPFLRPALDTKEGEAIEAAQAYINARVQPSGINGGDEE